MMVEITKNSFERLSEVNTSIELHDKGQHESWRGILLTAAKLDAARLTVRDDGCGFELQAQRGSAHGLMGMRCRVDSLGGEFRVEAAPWLGTQVQAWLPMQPSEVTAPPP